MRFNYRSYFKSHHPQTLASLKSILNSFFFLLSKVNPMDGNPPPDDPPPFDPLEPSNPVSYPLKTLEELESRSYFNSFHFPFNKASVKLPPYAANELPKRPRLLVCHDMAGGYLDDKWIQGGNNPDAYAIWHWYLIDVFVYFSHSLVTLPPPCWTNTAHKHGVKVLGTFIMEWDEGKLLANKLLSSQKSAQMYAEQLSELAAALGFDGWLVNMEVSLDVEQISNLKEFVSHLTQSMHSLVPGSLVIWYDSVTIDGNLSWQDQLNAKNKPFFDISDGIFVNYTWRENYPKHSAEVAGDRKFDVYMGIDVFGRNTYGGGQWTTNLALDVIKMDNVSAAIFAPGWVYETKQLPDFQTAQNRWWELVERSWDISQNYPQTLPFYSNFDQGHGYQVSVDGKQISQTPWNNISSQSFQPFLEFSGKSTGGHLKVVVDIKEPSYNGGGNLTFNGTLDDDFQFSARLFEGKLQLADSPLNFTYSVKSNGNSLLGLSLEFTSAIREQRSVLLASGDSLLTMGHFVRHFDNVIMPHRVTKAETEPSWVIQESSIAMEGYMLTKIHAVCYKLRPEVHKKVGQGKTVPFSPSEYHAVLGHLAINSCTLNSDFPPSTSWLVDGNFTKWSSSASHGSKKLNVKLVWKLKDGKTHLFPKYYIYVTKQPVLSIAETNGSLPLVQEFLGVAEVEAFYVSDLLVPSGTSSVKFIIQVCSLDGAFQKLEESPSLDLNIQGS
ncbi:Cytosolic endo-beta-N-acetylglucosaminidase 2 [Capsicum annuum]|uniref:mannosyl-glycoprotein endo-beta-N-acetylglucosaminidase n=1 Tax=Capsicum annuum TaxID=4072 RepID=A0A1U8GWE3_CAPAN|nr:cytosolic endo-beta-N-acetylglucosaminidase 1 [Capsicum annuum]KAF3632042.1 Cytosolic endo-beta-N-acetylglucosaminidase 2 [Capsicum annuum]KAF3642834.1 Cytosolic endo-beta-N-acetylglucosaminidase 2 [Capsicum annuum]PHT78320.1 Cytosolic endo-beta-N-acetylglucosaminidase 2 [Capsicum annuum]